MQGELARTLTELNEANRAGLPAYKLAVMDAATAALNASGLAERSLAVGAHAPEFALPDVAGADMTLSSLLARGPVVLAFYRGGWCPYSSTELRALQNRLEEITRTGATLVAVSPQIPDNSLSTAEKLDLSFPVLSDAGNAVARSYGLVFRLTEDLREVYAGFGLNVPEANGDGTFELPLPATFIIGTDGTVVWRFANADYTKRAEPDDVIAALATLRDDRAAHG